MIPCIRRPTWSSSVVVGVEHGLAGPILQAVNQKGWREVRGRHPQFHAPHVAQRLPTAWQKPAERWRILGVSRLAKPGLKALDHPNAPRDLPAQLLDPQAWTEGVDLPPQGQTEPEVTAPLCRYFAMLLRAASRSEACGSRSGRTRSSRAEQPWPEAAASTPQASRVEASLTFLPFVPHGE